MGMFTSDRSVLDYRTLFEALPGLYLVLTPHLTIVAASDKWLRATNTSREFILGCHVFDVFQENPNNKMADGVLNITRSMAMVLETKAAHRMPVQRFDVRKPLAEGGAYEERYWSIINAPVMDDSAEVAFILNHVEDVTDQVITDNALRASGYVLNSARLV